MKYKGKEIIKNCLLCENYHKHPCECTHCEDYDNFKISKDGKKLYTAIFDQGLSSVGETDCSIDKTYS